MIHGIMVIFPLKMAIFHSYASLPEGISCSCWLNQLLYTSGHQSPEVTPPILVALGQNFWTKQDQLMVRKQWCLVTLFTSVSRHYLFLVISTNVMMVTAKVDLCRKMYLCLFRSCGFYHAIFNQLNFHHGNVGICWWVWSAACILIDATGLNSLLTE